MSAAQIAHGRIKELEQELLEKDVALRGMQAKNQTLNDHARTLQVVGILLGVDKGDDIIKSVPEAARLIVEERDNITEHATHAARCQLINEIKAAFVPYDKLTAEQVIDLLCEDKESSDAE
jgi:hypothetical protein